MRKIGRMFLPNGESVGISQTQRAQPDGRYEIQDVEKLAEFERQKAEQLKSK